MREVSRTKTREMDVRRWSREDYARMAAAGVLRPDERVELVEGVVYQMTPQSGPHATAVHLVVEALRSGLPGAYVRVQSPLALGDRSEPEPDVAVVPGTLRDYREGHPTTALLVVEVADSSLPHDRGRKLPLYTRAGVPETWLLVLTRRELEVHRDPAESAYRERIVLRAGDRVAPLARPQAEIAVADLLP